MVYNFFSSFAKNDVMLKHYATAIEEIFQKLITLTPSTPELFKTPYYMNEDLLSQIATTNEALLTLREFSKLENMNSRCQEYSDGNDYISDWYRHNQVSKKIINCPITKYTKLKILNFILKQRCPELYGIVLVCKDDSVINITHPLRMLEFLNEENTNLVINEVYVYKYKTIPEEITANFANPEKENRRQEVKALTKLYEYYLFNKNKEFESQVYITHENLYTLNKLENIPNKPIWLLPMDIMNSTSFLPIYSYIIVKIVKGEIEGTASNCCLSANILIDNKSICTGTYGKLSKNGLTSLSHSNLTSAYSPYVIKNFPYILLASEMINKTYEILINYLVERGKNEN